MNIRNDIATVRMGEIIFFNDRVVPVRLPARSDRRTFAGMMGTVSGEHLMTTMSYLQLCDTL